MPRLAKTPSPKVMLQTIQILAKDPSPTGARAKRALQLLQNEARRTGSVTLGGDGIGFGLTDAWHIATLPVRGALAATNWTAQKLGITKGGSASPEQVRLGRMRAAANRRKAAEARARAADAQSEAEYRAAQVVADAADAEADANEAEATAKEAAMLTAEAEYLPGQVQQADAADDQQGSGRILSGRRLSTTVGSVFSQLAVAKARQLAAQDARTGVRRSPTARAIVANKFARTVLRARGIAA